ncbi:hypothetical protein JCM18916_1708 [Cutibacterium acnes JCM 18916]|nr:hypothetical protein JCM18916_1708 [Cutibacterium acnes JCM 18916]
MENAILDHDVAGFAAGTTPRQRSRIRSYLGVKVRPDDLESFAGIIGRGHQVATQDVMRLRRAHPDQPLSFIADRLGCSLSTVKRTCGGHATPRWLHAARGLRGSLQPVWLLPTSQ